MAMMRKRIVLALVMGAYGALAGWILYREFFYGADIERVRIEAVHNAVRNRDSEGLSAALADLRKRFPERADFEEARLSLSGKMGAAVPERALPVLEKLARTDTESGAKARLEVARLLLRRPDAGAVVDRAVTLLGEATELGEKQAAFELGQLYLSGILVKRDPDLAESYFMRAAQDVGDAALELSQLYQRQDLKPTGERAARDYAGLALRLYELDAGKGTVSAMVKLGDIYQAGDLFARDLVRAQKWYEAAADAGSTSAIVRLAPLLRDQDHSEKAREKAIVLLRRAIDAGSAQALSELAVFYQKGIGVEKDEKEANALFRRAADRGVLGAMVELGKAYRLGLGVAKDDKVAFDWFKQAADAGNAAGQMEVGLAYQQGLGVEADPALGLEWLIRSARLGRGSAMAAVSRAYHRGTGVARDEREALIWAERAVDAGVESNDLLMKVGRAYASGEILSLNTEKAVRTLSRAAVRGDSRAMILVGRILGISADEGSAKLAVQWFRRAEELGNPDALVALGRTYASGFGVPLDERKAFEYFYRAARLGSEIGMREVGNAYAIGFGVEKSPRVAVDWYTRAAERNDPDAMLALSYCYDAGIGAAVDTGESVKWLRRAADAGLPPAQYRLGMIFVLGKDVGRDVSYGRRYLKLAAETRFPPAVHALEAMDGHGPAHSSEDGDEH